MQRLTKQLQLTVQKIIDNSSFNLKTIFFLHEMNGALIDDVPVPTTHSFDIHKRRQNYKLL